MNEISSSEHKCHVSQCAQPPLKWMLHWDCMQHPQRGICMGVTHNPSFKWNFLWKVLWKRCLLELRFWMVLDQLEFSKMPCSSLKRFQNFFFFFWHSTEHIGDWGESAMNVRCSVIIKFDQLFNLFVQPDVIFYNFITGRSQEPYIWSLFRPIRQFCLTWVHEFFITA